MKLSNRLNLPESVVRLVAFPDRPREPEAHSVTQLILPGQICALTERHADELTEDAADRIWATYGTLMHLALERVGGPNVLQEERLSSHVGGWLVHGTPDLYEQDGTLSDFKFTSVWTTRGGVRPEWEQQLNAYAWLLSEHGFATSRLQVVALYRDWSKNRAHEHGYPSTQVEVFPVERWPGEATEHWLGYRVFLHQRAHAGEWGPCTAEERWERPTQYAVTKRGTKRAARLLDSAAAADEWAARNVPNGNNPERWFKITERKGDSVRCRSYCNALPFCEQGQALTAQSEYSESGIVA